MPKKRNLLKSATDGDRRLARTKEREVGKKEKTREMQPVGGGEPALGVSSSTATGLAEGWGE